jgi:O-antigen ligase
MLFEQGWFGLASFVMLLATAFAYCVRAVGAGNPAGAIVAASLVAFSIAGMADYLTEAPRLAILFYLVCFTALLLPASSRTSGQAPEQ